MSQDFKELIVKNKISSATVYLNKAEITRESNINLPKGKTMLVFKGLSVALDVKSIRISIDKNVDILQISTLSNFVKNNQDKPQIKKLKDSLNLLTVKLQNYTDEIDAYSIEKELLLANKEIGGQDNGVSIDELKQTADYYRNRIIEINKKISSTNFLYKKLTKDKERIQKQLDELNYKSGHYSNEIYILVESEQAVSTKLYLKYLVGKAGWSPAYDLKSEDTDSPVTLIYNAKVYNNTGIDWKNINLTLSTNDANVSNTKPILNTWFLEKIETDRNDMYISNVPITNEYFQEVMVEDQVGYQEEQRQLNGSYQYEATVPVLSHEFKIDKKYSVPADDKPYSVEIIEKELKADYQHYAITKIDKGVFLLAKIIGWEELNLIDGPANIYYAGSYIGNSFIVTRNVSDTLDFSLGRDNKVIVTRNRLNKYNSSQFIGNKKKTTFEYQYELKNNHKSAINIELTDQIPISQSDEIEIKVLELTGGKQNQSNGKVTWKINLKPGELRKIKFSFSVKYPKNFNIPLQQQKSKNIRYFN